MDYLISGVGALLLCGIGSENCAWRVVSLLWVVRMSGHTFGEGSASLQSRREWIVPTGVLKDHSESVV